jgi:hypothetical protein
METQHPNGSSVRYTSKHKLCFETLNTFMDLADYIWKAREQFNKLREYEQARLGDFPEAVRPLRAALEGPRHDSIFPRALHFSFTVLIFIEIENRLRTTCDIYQKAHGVPIRARDLRGDSIEQCMLFLDKFANVPRNSIVNWLDIADLIKVRNCIVHSSGRIDESRDKSYLEELIRKKPEYFRLEELDNGEKQLIVEHRYCFWLTKQARDFFQDTFLRTGLMQAEHIKG